MVFFLEISERVRTGILAEALAADKPSFSSFKMRRSQTRQEKPYQNTVGRLKILRLLFSDGLYQNGRTI